MGRVWIGCAGWSLPREWAGEFPGPGTHLERYGRVLPAVEISTTFHRPHRPETFERWAASVPAGFPFSLKTPARSRTSGGSRAATRGSPPSLTRPPALRYEEGVTRPFFGRVAADPPRTEVDAEPDGWRSHAYFRLHGSPRTYISAYDDGFLDALARRASATPARSG